MGLDMYLSAKRYVSEYNDQDKVLSTEIMRHFPELTAGQSLREITVRVGYWRKVNHIHKWFVTNVQEGEDNCASYYVSIEKLKELRQLCQQVADFQLLAVDNLPTANGFFFGTTDYDEYYFESVKDTVKILDSAIKLVEAGDWDIEYSSSW
jgi:hypothetical protein